ncbi:hypothetical protein ASPBRDRAFT_45198 [Aspergillus brasiliensis CBS 101740]|uniref:Uncharacterized protein n=1 Tax=Aspergillus brasiliensis (strain CBS 101740 / IMI 381727 / IBT 21946) TaxID=767769 RepID=A0A1L9UE04_ASPBC|nr:hypothetical protein ASPBRDRAFT_45198 [Aspergillus brasiliensis CBS 101740]
MFAGLARISTSLGPPPRRKEKYKTRLTARLRDGRKERSDKSDSYEPITYCQSLVGLTTPSISLFVVIIEEN